MANSLTDIIRQQRAAQDQENQVQGQQGITRDTEGQLSSTPGSTSPTGVQQLAGQAGLSATPTSPLSTALIGGNANQQKMAGSAQQKQAAITQATVPGESLQETLRTQQVRTQATGAEQGEMQKSQDMQNLGGLGDRVTDFINNQRQKLESSAQQTAAGTTAGVDVAAADTYTGGSSGQAQDLSPLKDTLKQLRADPTNMDLQLQVNKALGYDINTQLTPDQINQLYESSVSAISQGGAQVVDDKLSVDDLVNLPNFGYNTQQLSGLLGVPADQLAGMSVGQLKDAITAEQQKEMSKASGLDAKAQSGLLGQAERGEARQAAAETSQTGLRASEADVQKLVGSIQNADQVQFGGQSYKVDDLLKDSTISGIITDYLNSAPGSVTRTQLEQSEPGLIDFINDNQKVLQDAATKLSQGSQQFTDIQTANRGVGTIAGQQLNTDLLNAIVPNYGQLASSKIDTTKIPLLQNLQNTTQPATAVANLNAGIAQDPSVIQQIQALDPGKLNDLLVANNGQNMSQYIGDVGQYNQDQARDKSNLNNNFAIAFGGDTNLQQFQSNAAQADYRSYFALPTDSSLAQYAGLSNDQLNGKLNQYIDSQGRPTLDAAAGGQNQSLQTQKAGSLPILNQEQKDMMSKIQAQYGNSTNLSVSQLASVPGISMTQISALVNSGAKALGQDAQGQFTAQQSQNAQKNFPSSLSALPSVPDTGQLAFTPSDTISNAISKYNQKITEFQSMLTNPTMLDTYGRDNIQAQIDNLHKQIDPIVSWDQQKWGNSGTPVRNMSSK